MSVPLGYLWSIAFVGLGTLLALRPVDRPPPVETLSSFFGIVVNELPFVMFYWLLASTLLALDEGDLSSAGGVAALGVAALTTAGLAAVVWRGLQTRAAIQHALLRDLGDPQGVPVDSPSRGAVLGVLFAPFPLWRRDVQKIRNLSYGEAGKANRLDLYRPRSHSAGAPVFIHFHGGRFRMGGKSREARAIFYRLAAHGWLCASANYRLRQAGEFPNSLIDAKRAIGWIKQHAREYDADPGVLIVAGSSAGAHLAAMAALTQGDDGFQPGFERQDTSVSAAVCLYGYYGERKRGGSQPSSPRAYLRADAPPFFLLHGTADVATPAEAAADLAGRLRGISSSPVVYAELPGAAHSFDMFRSVRLERVIDGIETFGAWVRQSAGPQGAGRLRE